MPKKKPIPPSEAQNSRRARPFRNNTSGYKGVARRPSGRWRAQICVDNICYSLGTFDTPEQADEQYKRAAIELNQAW